MIRRDTLTQKHDFPLCPPALKSFITLSQDRSPSRAFRTLPAPGVPRTPHISPYRAHSARVERGA